MKINTSLDILANYLSQNLWKSDYWANDLVGICLSKFKISEELIRPPIEF